MSLAPIPKVADGQQLLTTRQAAKWLGVSPRTLWSMTDEGCFPVVRLRDYTLRYDVADLAAYVTANKTTAKKTEAESQ
jgi:excisionase family DNA binding protein